MYYCFRVCFKWWWYNERLTCWKIANGLASAQKYPNAYVAVTGGGTAKNNPNATEADQMAAWMIANGLDENRLIVENKSKSTVQNAQFTKCFRKVPNFSCGDIRQLFLRFYW